MVVTSHHGGLEGTTLSNWDVLGAATWGAERVRTSSWHRTNCCGSLKYLPAHCIAHWVGVPGILPLSAAETGVTPGPCGHLSYLGTYLMLRPPPPGARSFHQHLVAASA